VNHLVNLIGLSSYPLLYFYLCAETGRPARVRTHWWLWGPGVVYAAVLVGRTALGVGTRVPFAWMLPVLLAFTALCASLVIRRQAPPAPRFVRAEWIVLFLVVLNAAQVVRMVFGHVPLVPALIPTVVTGGFVALVALVVRRALEDGTTRPAPKYAKSGLDAEGAAALLERIDATLDRDRLFADATLTLPRLAAALDCTPHQVSEVLNRYASVTFHDLLNRRRVADVKAQLLDPASDRFTIEGIGAAAGFGSRSAMYAAFRRLEGMTPRQFRERARSDARGEPAVHGSGLSVGCMSKAAAVHRAGDRGVGPSGQ
jgi:AraC-like DNA-binding protein